MADTFYFMFTFSRNVEGYRERVMNSVTNFCAATSMNMTYRYLYAKADIQVYCYAYSVRFK